jgi:hypothetical protein
MIGAVSRTPPTPSSPPPLERADLAGRTALVLGLGRWSGGVETVRFLHRVGAHAIVSDSADPASLAASVAAIDGTGATIVFGPQTPALLDRLPADGFVVASPAIPFDHPVLVEAARRGVPTTSEIALFTARVRAPVLGVTGTKGKSTTSTLLAAMLTASGRRTHLGGNVGRSLLNDLDAIGPDDAVVLELSSFQLFGLARTGFRPAVAVVTNLLSRPPRPPRHDGALRGEQTRAPRRQDRGRRGRAPVARRDARRVRLPHRGRRAPSPFRHGPVRGRRRPRHRRRRPA